MSIKTTTELREAVEFLQEDQQLLVFKFVDSLLNDDDDIATPDEARAEYARGETCSMEEINAMIAQKQ